jgi:hypothetical protein
MPAYATLARVRFDRLFLDADAIAEAHEKGKPLAQKLFGPELGYGGPAWAGISYGHINALGCPLLFPEDSEVAHKPIYGSLAEGIAALNREVDFSTQGMFPFYLDLREKLRKRYPQEKFSMGGFKAEGPITTAWALRGHDFFADILERPEAAREYLRLVTDSVIRYNRLLRRLDGAPEFNPAGCGLADDVAAMISPARWPELVMPFLEQYYAGLTSGKRSAHIEDLTLRHLPFLDELRLASFDPSVSPRLTAEMVRDHCRVPFTWRLNSTHYVGRSPAQVEDWVWHAAGAGACGIFTLVARDMCTPECAEKVRAFIRAARQVKGLLDSGCPRGELAKRR